MKPHVGPGGGDQTEPIEHAGLQKDRSVSPHPGRVGLTQHETAILLLNTPDAEAVWIADRILAHIEPMSRMTLSLGLACFPRDRSNDTALLTRAQTLLGEAAHSGGNRVA